MPYDNYGDKRPQGGCICERKWPATVLGLGILATGVIGFALACVLVDMKAFKYKYHYGVVLDAGSSHTDIVVYKWPSNYKKNGTAKVEEVAFEKCSDVGISSFKNNPVGVEDLLRKCVENVAVKKLPSKEIPRTHLYLGATAGMRLLCATNKSICQQIMVAARKALDAYNFVIEDDSIKILSGEQEGVCGWISANLLIGAIGHDKENFRESNLVGAIDLGGGSLEMTFYPKSVATEDIPSEDQATVRLYGGRYILYSHSYLCYGLREIERKLIAKLVQDSGFERNVTNPCYPAGYEVNLTSQYLWMEPCSPKPAKSIFPQRENYSYVINGGSSYSDCKAVVNAMFNKSGCEKYRDGHCSFNGVYQPPVAGKFLAFAGFAYVAKALNISSSDNIKLFDDKAKDICAKKWKSVDEDFAYESSQFRHKYCFNSVYIYQLFTEGFHFPENSSDVSAVDKIGDEQVNWSRGFMVNATNLIQNDSKLNKITKSEYVAIMAASGLLSLIGLTVLVVCCYKRRRRTEARYRPLEPDD